MRKKTLLIIGQWIISTILVIPAFSQNPNSIDLSGKWNVTWNDGNKGKNSVEDFIRFNPLLDSARYVETDVPLDLNLAMQRLGLFGDINLDMYNIPSSGYVFDVMGPASWRISYWYAGTGGGVGFEYGNFAQNIELGKGSWHNISLTTFGDSIACSGNNEVVKTFRNLSFMDNGLYLTVEDKKQDTILFRNITLEK